MARQIGRQRDREAVTVPDRALRERDREAAVAAVVRAREQRLGGGRDQQVEQRPLLARDRAPAASRRCRRARPRRTPTRRARRPSRPAGRSRARASGTRSGPAAGESAQQPEHPDHRRRVDRAVAALVVEAHVAAGHRRAERLAGVAHPADRLGELPHHLGPLGVAEVQAVRDRDRPRAGDRDVARRLGDRVHRAQVRVEPAEPALPVARDDRALQRARDPDHRGVGLRARDRVALHHPVVLPPHPALRGDARRGRAPCGARRSRSPSNGVSAGSSASTRAGSARGRSYSGPSSASEPRRHLRDHLAAVTDRELAALDERRDHRRLQAPAAHRPPATAVELGRVHDREHPLLGLAGQDLERLHVGRAQRDRVEVDVGAHPGAGRGLADAHR